MGLARRITTTLPQPVRFALRRAAYWGTGQTCPLCGHSVRRFIDHGYGHPVLDTRQVVGGMRRAADRCPVCHGCDRTRMMMLWLERAFAAAPGRRWRVLHVAPDLGLYLWLSRRAEVDYTASDIDAARYRHIPGTVQADLTAAPFDDASFDLVICSHVLEHVPDDRKAMDEIRRILVPGGQALLLVPFALDGAGTDEAPDLSDRAERIRRFGQWDHIRLYDRDDFLARLDGVGFETDLFVPFDSVPDRAAELGLNPLETLPIAWRPG